jgi:endonuclease YncB( thermonuclease family)
MADGAEWPCGMVALTSLRRFLRGRAVECYYSGELAGKEIVAPCRVGPTDIGGWLVTQGWAAAAELADISYQQSASDARCARRGLWRDEQRSDSCPP